MKTIYTALVLSFLLSFSHSNANAQNDPVLSLVTSLSLHGVTALQFDSEAQLDVQYWNQNYLQIEIIVADPQFTKAQLKSLIPMGFFRVAHRQEGGKFVLSMPGQERKLTINGLEVNSFVKVRLTVPTSLSIDEPLHPWQ